MIYFMPAKINSEGRYLPYPGVTVVAAIKEADKPFWQLIYETITKNKEFTNYFSPLPYESYHLTTINLYTKDATGSRKWREFIVSNRDFFLSIKDLLTKKSFTPIVLVESIQIAGALQIIVTLPEEQIKIIQQVAKAHHVEMGIPTVFHITLAYQFKYVETQILEKLRLTLKEELFAILKAQNSVLTLTPPELCFFNDMTKFVPWSGDRYPFSESIGDSKIFFSTEEESSEKEKPLSSSRCLIA